MAPRSVSSLFPLLPLLIACGGSNGMAPPDPGVPPGDAGPVVDTGTPPADGGSPTPDAGTDPGTDAGTPVDTGTPPTEPTCPAELFVDVMADPENGAYPDPSLTARCEGGDLVVASNGIPDYEFVQTTPNALQAQDYNWRVTLTPELASAPTDIPLLGTVAFTLNGLPIFGPNEGEFPDPYGDPVYNDILDYCLGHTGFGGAYHFHALLAGCIGGDTGATEPSPLLGYAMDGFPIYGPRGCADASCSEVVTYTSGWVQTGDPTTYAWDNHSFVADDDSTTLDQCNGHVGPQGDYHYHATDSFPYVLGCYAGSEPADGGGGPGGPPGRP